MFAVGHDAGAAQGGSYTVTMRWGGGGGGGAWAARSRSGTADEVDDGCSDWGTKSQYSTLAGSSREDHLGRRSERLQARDPRNVHGADRRETWFIPGQLHSPTRRTSTCTTSASSGPRPATRRKTSRSRETKKSTRQPEKLARSRPKAFPITSRETLGRGRR